VAEVVFLIVPERRMPSFNQSDIMRYTRITEGEADLIRRLANVERDDQLREVYVINQYRFYIETVFKKVEA
jgi:hypothetical protein